MLHLSVVRHEIYFLEGTGSVWITLITENWKHYSKIIFKCVNSIVGPGFKEKFVEIRTCGSYEQCTGLIQKKADAQAPCFQCNPNILRVKLWVSWNLRKLLVWKLVSVMIIRIVEFYLHLWVKVIFLISLLLNMGHSCEPMVLFHNNKVWILGYFLGIN